MENFGRPMKRESVGTDRRPGWAWLAAAAAAGFWFARRHPRATLALGVGFALWRRGEVRAGDGQGGRPLQERQTEPRKKPRAMGEENGQGGWLLNLEPLPLVVREDPLPATGQGQGDGLLNLGPGQTIEELDWVPPFLIEESWLNEGGEIPDSVELPELDGPPGSVSSGPYRI